MTHKFELTSSALMHVLNYRNWALMDAMTRELPLSAIAAIIGEGWTAGVIWMFVTNRVKASRGSAVFFFALTHAPPSKRKLYATFMYEHNPRLMDRKAQFTLEHVARSDEAREWCHAFRTGAALPV